MCVVIKEFFEKIIRVLFPSNVLISKNAAELLKREDTKNEFLSFLSTSESQRKQFKLLDGKKVTFIK